MSSTTGTSSANTTTTTSSSSSSSSTITSTTSFETSVQYGFFFDQSRCIACMTCTVACKTWNQLDPGPAKWLRIYEWESGTFPTPEINTLYAPCYHCQNPVCVDAADGAMFKEPKYGAVLIDPNQASSASLRAAWEACPYGSIVFDSDAPNANASKCTMCIDRLEQGLMPICVLSCQLRALDFGKLSDLQTKYGTNSQLGSMPDPSTTTPSVVFKPKDARQQIVTLDTSSVISLMGDRSPLPAVYTDPSTVTTITPGLVGRSQLNMKASSTEELLSLTCNDDA
jgi:anaerobic dimethyl sulfoxide reductase subunit B